MSNIERIKCGNGNVYLISEGKNTVLVDTSIVSFKNMILQKCKHKNVRLIILTHGHVDHIQNAAFLSKELNAPLAMSEKDYGLSKDNLTEPMFVRSLLGKIILKLSQNTFREKAEPFEPAVFLKDGDSLSEYGISSASIIELPGHTKGSIGIKIGETDIIVGDALMNMAYPTKSPLYGDRAAMEKSAAKISSLGNATIHFGHGKPLKNRNW